MEFVAALVGLLGLTAASVPWLTGILIRRPIQNTWIKCCWFFFGVGLVIVAASLAWVRNDKPIRPAEHHSASNHIARCADCHAAQTEFFQSAPHSQTLRRADQPSEWIRYTKQSAPIGLPVKEFRYWERGGRLWGGRGSSGAAVDWFFGSGHHGQTAVTVRSNDRGETMAVEHHVTWYATHGLARTIGRPVDLGRDKDDVGEVNDPATTRKCFGCHSTHLSGLDGRIDFDQIIPGVLCARCHEGAEQHADATRNGKAASKFDDRRKLSSFESVARCGQCHRMPTEFNPIELSARNPAILRFAPVGLLMSKCFQLQHTLEPAEKTRRLDCLMCHDPHRPTETEPNFYNRHCQQCHDGKSESQIACRNQPPESDCISCHMPKVSIDVPAQFTDHWIRVRDREPGRLDEK